MKVLLVNGSPNKEGCTNTALNIIAETLTSEGIDSEIFWLGIKPIAGCIACKKCFDTKKCVFDDCVNAFAEKAKTADGFIFGSPVHYAAASGALTSFMDRLFYSASSNFLHKPTAAIVSARRAGTTAALDQINKYFSFAQMPIVTSRYWNMVHGTCPQEVLMDEEGCYTMRVLARNMAYLLKCIECASGKVELPKFEKPCKTNFIKID